MFVFNFKDGSFYVSAIFYRRWYPLLMPPRKKLNHRALDDIKESIEELKFYKQTIFKNQQDVFLK